MNQPTVWWTLAGGLIAVEMLTGTFYLLMMALGMAGGALAAHAGIGITGQMWWRRWSAVALSRHVTFGTNGKAAILPPSVPRPTKT